MRDTMFFSKLRVLLCGWRWKSRRRGSWLKARLRRLRRSASRLREASLVKRISSWGSDASRCTPHASRFVIEPLESRLLLAADLTGLVQSAALIDPAVPTNNASAVVQVQNVGNQRVNQSQVGVYASLDTTLDASDVLLGTANTGQLNAGQSKNVTTNLTIPSTLDAITYRLLAKLDNANAITENSEANNVAVGGTINVAWKFGNVPGRSGNTALTLRDADGTSVTFRLTGSGVGEVLRDGANWDVKVTGTTASSAVTITTNSGGNGRVMLNDVHVFGPLASLTAATTDLTGTLAIDGPVNIPGLLPGTITLGSIQGGTVAVPSVEALTILGSTTNARFYIGTTLGQDGQPGGSGANVDTYGQGRIGLFTVTGAMSGTAVRVGINPVDGVYGNGNDQLIGGTSSSIGGIVIGGALSADTRFYAGAFPTQYLHGLTLKPTAGDFHFVSNFSGPNLTAALQQDTGSSTTDTLTNNPAITGSVTDPQGIATFTAGFGATPTFNVLSDRQADGSFTFTRARLEQINGAPLTDSTYILKLLATDTAGNSTQITVSFTLDTQVPVLTLDLDPASDTAPVGDQQTTHDIVTLVGQTEALVTALLLETSQTTTADASGNFSFSNVALAVGANSFTVRATDTAGNQRTATRTITRLLADSDGDGIPDANEGGGPNGGDANNDGVLDSQQANVASLQNAIDNQYVTLVSPTGTTLRNVQAGPVAPGAPVGVDFPFGQFGFEVHGVTPGAIAQVTMLLPTGSLVDSFYKYGPEPGAPPLNQAHWYDFNFTGGTGATISGDTITLSFIDGARGDADLAANGVIVDPGAPSRSANQPPVLAPIGPQSVNEGSELRFTVTATDPNPSDDLFFEFFPRSGNLFGAQFVSTGVNTYEFIWTPGEGEGPGEYQVQFNVIDGINPPSSEIVTITVNEVNQAPEIIVTGPTTVNEENFLELNVRGLDLDLPLNVLSPVTVTGLPVGATFDVVNVAANVYSLQWTPTEADGPGVYDVIFTVSDGQGGVTAQPVSLTVNEVNRPPVIVSIDGPPEVDEQTEWQAVVTASDPDLPANTLSASLDSTAVALGVTITPGTTTNTWNLRWTPNEAQGVWPRPGVYNFGVVVSDNVPGSPSVSQTVAVTVNEVNQPPVLNAIGNKTVVEGTRQLELAPIGNWAVAEATPGLPTLSFPVTATNQGPGVPPLTFTATATDDDLPANNRTFSLAAPSVVPPGAIGGVPAGAQIDGTSGEFVWNLDESHVGNTYAFDVVVKDGSGTTNDSDFETITVTVIGNGQPNNLTFSLEAPLVVPPGSIGGVPDGATINSMTDLFEWAPTELQGGNTYAFDVVVTSGAETDRETITVTVDEVNRPPVIESINAPAAVDEMTPWQALVTASDPDLPANTLSAGLDSAAVAFGVTITPGATLNTWDLNWTPSEAQGPAEYTFNVVLSDNVPGSQPVSQPVTVTVNEVNRQPELVSIGNQIWNEEETHTIVLNATDLDRPVLNTLTYGATGLGGGPLPVGANFDASTRTFIWNPTELQGGTGEVFTVVFTVTDNGTPVLSDSETITITVNEINKPPVLSAIVPELMDEETVQFVPLTATDPDLPANSLTFELNGAPVWATIVPETDPQTPHAQQLRLAPDEAAGLWPAPGVYTFDVVARDGALGTPDPVSVQSVTVTVNEVNVAPELGPINIQIGAGGAGCFGAPITIVITATDRDIPQQALTFTASGLTPEMTFDPATRTFDPTTGTWSQTFTWTPSTPGVAPTVTFTVSDGVLTDSEPITLPLSGDHVCWINPAGGDWNVASNWSTGRVPTATDDVDIHQPGAYTITHSSGTSIIKSLTSEYPIILTGGTLEVAEPVEMNGALLTLMGGTLKNATVNGTGVGGVVIQVDEPGGTLDGVTLQGPSSVMVSPLAQLIIERGLTINGDFGSGTRGVLLVFGNILVNGSSGSTQAIGGTSGQIDLRVGSSLSASPGVTLDLGDMIGIASFASSIGSADSTTVGRGYIQITGNGSLELFNFTNHGYVDVFGGLSVSGPFVSHGNIEAHGGSNLSFPEFDNQGNVWVFAAGPGGELTATITMTDINPLINRGVIEIRDGLTVNLNGSLLNTGAGQVFLGLATGVGGNGQLQVFGDVTNDSGATVWLRDGLMTVGGTLRDGSTVSGTLTNDGTIHLQGGVLTVNGDYTQSSTGTLSTELASVTDFGRLGITGMGTLSGLLQAGLVGGFTPSLGQAFQFMMFDGGLTGFFAASELPAGLVLDDSDPFSLSLVVT
ncbi:MAG: LEPR-XLL domain-containing protein [Nitrospira defluvii]|nr:LEPR-XLL domain-containing protein [Nitrospira defluvii]